MAIKKSWENGMKAIKLDLPRMDVAEVHVFADLHIGDKFCDKKLIKERIDAVKDKEHAYVILNGDIINNATTTSVSDSYAEEIPPMEQLAQFVELFDPVKEKILCITSGNHENRTYNKEGIDITRLCARQLGIEDRYSKTGMVLFLRIESDATKNKHTATRYVIYCNHGSGGGRKEGAKAIRLADMASIVDADIYIHSHTHLPMILKEGFYRTDVCNSTITKVDKLFVNTSAMLDFGGYGEAFEFKPSSKDTPVIYLSGQKKKHWAKL